MDFIRELNDSTLYTFHSHTEFCDGRAQMEAFARRAVADGFTHYGFTPHCPLPIESPCNMRQADVPRYFDEVERIRRDHGDRCRFYAGMEIDYLEGVWGPANPYFATLSLDYALGSVHFIRAQRGEWVDIDGRFEAFRRKMEEHFHNDIRYVVETFYRMLDEGHFDILGHYDKIGLNASLYRPGIEEEQWYRTLADGLTDHVIALAGRTAPTSERPLTVEINTKAYAEHSGRLFPARRHVAALHEAGVPIIVNSDAHVPALINASREIVLNLLK